MNSRALLILFFLIPMLHGKNADAKDYEFTPFQPFYIENLDLGKNSSLNLIVISNGNFVRKMNWLNPLTSSIFDFYSIDLNKSACPNWVIVSGASSQQPQLLIDGRTLAKPENLSLIVKKGKQVVDLMANTQANQDLIKLLRAVRSFIQSKNLKVEKIIFIISTEWNFSALFNKGEPEQSMQDLLDSEIKQIHIVQVHQSGDFGINKEFDEALKKAELNLKMKVHCHNIPFEKIFTHINQPEQDKESKNFIIEIKKKLSDLFKNKIL